MRSPKLKLLLHQHHRLGGATSTRQRRVIAAVILTSATAVLLLLLITPSAPNSNSNWTSSHWDWMPPFLSVDADSTSPPAPLSSPSPVDNWMLLHPQTQTQNYSPPFSPHSQIEFDSYSSTAPSPSPTDTYDFLQESESESESPHIDLTIPHEHEQPDSSDIPISNLDSTQSQALASQIQSFQPQAPRWPSPADQELLLAKREVEAAPLVSDDPDLYAPLFRNVSIFKRSYELMEKTLKVYIYQEGERPIFHTPELKGIYASEGWFMKLLEGNKQYTTKDPARAHLFYLPYSSRRLEYALYVPGSHTIVPLSNFVKGYVEMLSAKYPFWNRTRGADHFFVACHDWGPYTTKLHEELRKNTIKALCNADTSEGVFIQGKDVSLPETFIKFPKRPQRDVGGKPVSQRTILAFYAGQMHGRVRPILVQHWGDDRDPEMRVYARLPKSISRKMSYSQHMKSSKYCICPMGYEVNSPRIVEAIYNGCVPVIIADHFVLPFNEVLNWQEFSVVVLESDIPKLKEILVGISQKQYMDLWMNVNRVQRHFLWHMKPEKYDLFHMLLHSIWFSRLNHMHSP